MGLTPQRFGYVAVAALAALAAWHAIPILGGALAGLLLAVGAAFGWLQWRGRGLDHWVAAASLWLVRTRRLEVRGRVKFGARLNARPRRPAWRRRPPPPSLPAILREPPPIRRLQVLKGVDGDP